MAGPSTPLIIALRHSLLPLTESHPSGVTQTILLMYDITRHHGGRVLCQGADCTCTGNERSPQSGGCRQDSGGRAQPDQVNNLAMRPIVVCNYLVGREGRPSAPMHCPLSSPKETPLALILVVVSICVVSVLGCASRFCRLAFFCRTFSGIAYTMLYKVRRSQHFSLPAFVASGGC